MFLYLFWAHLTFLNFIFTYKISPTKTNDDILSLNDILFINRPKRCCLILSWNFIKKEFLTNYRIIGQNADRAVNFSEEGVLSRDVKKGPALRAGPNPTLKI